MSNRSTNEAQKVWLAAHPNRSRKWLKAILAEGFCLHHADGNHQNNSPHNLVLIEGIDHMLLHGLGRSDGKMTGQYAAKIRMIKVSPERRSEIAKVAAMARWHPEGFNP